MPCLAMHLAIAKKYLEKHPEENYDEFILGTIAPDISIENKNDYIKGLMYDKNSRHFEENRVTSSAVDYLQRKVDFQKFFQENDINTSFLRAYFLHLICDGCFFGYYITDKEFSDLSFEEGIRLAYNDYDLITPILIKKYDLVIPDIIKEIVSNKGIGEIRFLKEDIVDHFIEKMSNIKLQDEKVRILQEMV